MKILRVILAIVCLAGMSEIWSVRNANEWETKNPPVYGLIPYYEQNNEVWVVLKNYTYNNGQKGLSAVLDYASQDMSDLGLNFFEHAQAFEQKLKGIGINQSVITISCPGRCAVYVDFDFIKINPSDISKLGNMKREDGTIEVVKFSDLYTAQCLAQNSLLTSCTIAGKNVFFLTSFFKSFVNQQMLNKIQTELKVPPVPVQTQVQPQPVITPLQPTPTPSQPVKPAFKGLVVNKPQFSTVQDWSKKNLSGLVPYYKLPNGEVRVVLGYNDPYGDAVGGVSTALFETDKDMNIAARDEGYINHFGPISKAGSFSSNGARYDLYIVEVVDRSKLVPQNLAATKLEENLSDLSKLGTIDASSPLILPVQGLGLLAPVFKNFAGALLASKNSFTRPSQPTPLPTQVPVPTKPVVTPPQSISVQVALQELAVRLNDLSLKVKP